MHVIILGSEKKSVGIAKSCLSIADSILIYDKDQPSLNNVRLELDEQIGKDHHLIEKLEYCSDLKMNYSGKSIVFDCISDQEKDITYLKQLFSELSLKASILFTTSQCYSVTYLASLTADPKRVVGLQFLTDFEGLKMVELIKGIHTAQTVLENAQHLLEQMGKNAIIVKDSPGFLLNRLVLVLINEAIYLLNEGIGTPKEIDSEMELSIGMKIGPLRLADTIGLDRILKMLNHLYEGTGNPKFLPCPLLQNMVDAGYLGVETNNGFFNYSADILNFPHLKS